ncbi:hypothetical protein EON66_09495 [archaeon]|nr:MAG: hypothetical protein EON66_09495 [archaeon]
MHRPALYLRVRSWLCVGLQEEELLRRRLTKARSGGSESSSLFVAVEDMESSLAALLTKYVMRGCRQLAPVRPSCKRALSFGAVVVLHC